jgi:hypothetical protein
MADGQSTIHIDGSAGGEPVRIRDHCLGQGGVDDVPFSPAVVDRLVELRPPLIRMFIQEFFRMMESPGVYHWQTVDRAVESIVATGATPLLALCMKPKCLFPKVDHSITTPTDWRAWEDFVEAAVRHFARDRGWEGIWYEVGNEPNIGERGGCPYLFEPQAYGEYYARTVRAVRRGDPSGKVGGPALAGPPFGAEGAPWPGQFAQRIVDEGLPLDFFSWHSYSQDAERLETSVRDAVAGLRALGEPFASAATVFGEWNITYNCNFQPGEYVQSAFLVDTVGRLLSTGLDYSCYYHVMDCPMYLEKWRDWFSAEGMECMRQQWYSQRRALHLLTQDGEASAAYVAFRMLYEMEGRNLAAGRLSRSIAYLATRRGDSIRLLVWSYHHEELVSDTVTVRIDGLPEPAFRERRYRLGGMDRLVEDVERLHRIREGRLTPVVERHHQGAPAFRTTLDVKPFSVHLIELEFAPE